MSQADRDLFDVPVADVTTNATVIEGIGNKEDAAVGTVGTTKSIIAYIKGILTDTGTTLPTDITKIPHSDGTATFNGTALAAINAEVDTALNTAVPTTPTAKSINDIMSKADGANTFDNTTDSIEMISDKIGAFSGDGGAAADDSAKALLDLIKTDTSAISAPPVSTSSATATGVIVEDTAAGTPKVVTLTSDTEQNSFGAWGEIDASVSADSWICSGVISLIDTSSGETIVFEIGTGAGGSEATQIRKSIYYKDDAGGSKIFFFSFPIPIKVASGVRIAARVANGSNASADTYAVSLQYYQTLET